MWSINPYTNLTDLRPHAVPVIISWLVIVIMTGVIIVMQYQAQHENDHVDIHDASRVNLQLRLMGRYMLGVHQMTGALAGTPSGAIGDKMIGEIEAYADRPIDQLRIVPVIAELAGKDVALTRLSELGQNPFSDAELRRDIQDMKIIYGKGVKSLGDEDRARLKRRHNWFALLALSSDMNEDNPARVAVLAGASRTVMTLIIFMVVLGLGGLAGLVLLILGIVFLSNGRIQRAYTAPTTSSSYWLETVAIFLVAFVLLSEVSAMIEKSVGPDMPDLMIWLLPLVLLWPRLRGATWQQWREGLGIHSGQGIVREMLVGVAGQLAGLPLLFLSLLVVLALSFLFMEPAPHPVFDQVLGDGSVWSVVKLYILACVWAPLFEEVTFRGAFYHHMRYRWHAIIAGLISGMIFAAIHPQGLIALPALMTLAFVFAMLREWRGSAIASMTAHACNNCFVFTLLLLMLR